jgi:hypothetical protein
MPGRLDPRLSRLHLALIMIFRRTPARHVAHAGRRADRGGSGASAPLGAGHVLSRHARARPLIPGVRPRNRRRQQCAPRSRTGHNLLHGYGHGGSPTVCGQPLGGIELVAPGQLPADWDQWDHERRDALQSRRDPGRWLLLFEGVAAGTSCGRPWLAKTTGIWPCASIPPRRPLIGSASNGKMPNRPRKRSPDCPLRPAGVRRGCRAEGPAGL